MTQEFIVESGDFRKLNVYEDINFWGELYQSGELFAGGDGKAGAEDLAAESGARILDVSSLAAINNQDSTDISSLHARDLSISGEFSTDISSLAANEQSFEFEVTTDNANPLMNSPTHFKIDGATKPNIQLLPGAVYKFKQSDFNNINNRFKFSTNKDGTHAVGGSEFTNNVTHYGSVNGAPPNFPATTEYQAYTEIRIGGDAPSKLYYFSEVTAGLGGEISINHINDISSLHARDLSISGEFSTDTSSLHAQDVANEAAATLAITNEATARGDKDTLLDTDVSSLHAQDLSTSGEFSIDVSSLAAINNEDSTDISSLHAQDLSTSGEFSTDISSLAANEQSLEFEVTTDVTNLLGQTATLFKIDGAIKPNIQLVPGATYRFKQSDISNTNNRFKFSTNKDGTHQSPGGSEFTNNVVYNSSVSYPLGAEAYTEIRIGGDAPSKLYYFSEGQPDCGGEISINHINDISSLHAQDVANEAAATLAITNEATARGDKDGLLDTDISSLHAQDLSTSGEFSTDISSLAANEQSLEFNVTADTTNGYFKIDGGIKPSIQLSPGATYKFKQSDTTNLNNLLKFSENKDGTHQIGGTEFVNVSYNGTPGTNSPAESYTEITIKANFPSKLYYFSAGTAGYGGEISINHADDISSLAAINNEDSTDISSLHAQDLSTSGEFSIDVSSLAAINNEDSTDISSLHAQDLSTSGEFSEDINILSGSLSGAIVDNSFSNASFSTAIPSGVDSHQISFPTPFLNPPQIGANLEILAGDQDSPIIPFVTSGITSQSYNVLFAQEIPNDQYKINTLFGYSAGGADDSARTMSFTQTLTQGQSDFEIAYPQQLASTPRVGITIENNTNSSIIPFQISGVTSSDFHITFAEDIPSNDYKVHTILENALAPGGAGGGGESLWEEATTVGDIHYTGDVGIGTDTPAAKLDIDAGSNSAQAIQFRGHILPASNANFDLGSAEYKIRHLFLSDNSLYIGGTNITAGDTLGEIQIPSGIAVTKDSSFIGSVGIGTAIPGATLHLAGQVPRVRLEDNDPASETTSWDLMNNSSVFTIQSRNADLTEIHNRFHISTDGNVGIGSANPVNPDWLIAGGSSAQLHVKGDDYGALNLQGDHGQKTEFMIGAGDGKLYFWDGLGALINDPDGNAPGDAGYVDTWDPNGQAHRLTIENNGNIGIGNTTPSYKLQVHGEIACVASNVLVTNGGSPFGVSMYSPEANEMGLSVDGNEAIRIDSNGNVGINTENPSNKLEIVGPYNGMFKLIRDDDTNQSMEMHAGAGTIKLLGIDAGNNSHTRFVFTSQKGTTTTERMRIENNGYVGIGTADPSETFHVHGGAEFAKRKYISGTITAAGAGKANGQAISLGSELGTTLSTSHQYKITLKVTSTGTHTGSVYILTYSTLTTTWTLRCVSRAGSHSNHCLLDLSDDDTKLIAYHNHASTYPIGYFVEILDMASSYGTLHSWGSDYQWARDENTLSYADGNVLIGTGTPDTMDGWASPRFAQIKATSTYACLNLQGTWNSKNSNYTIGAGGGKLYLAFNQSATNFEGGSASRHGIIVQADGAVHMGGETSHGVSTYRLYVVGSINATGDVYNSGVALTSDDRLKHNEKTIVGALDTLAKITPKKYIKTTEMYDADHDFELDAEGNPIDEDGELVEHRIEAGVIAQEVLTVDELAFAVTPETVDENGEVTDPHYLNYNSLFTYAIAAIKELKQENDDLKSRIENLENN